MPGIEPGPLVWYPSALTTEQEELEKFETVRNNWHVTQMLYDSFKEEITYKYGYDSNEETSEDEIVEEHKSK